MIWAWTWSGRCFGYWIKDDLWTYRGKHIGRRFGADIYAPDGHYIGELMSDGCLITDKAKADLTGPLFIPTLERGHHPRLPDNQGHIPYKGYADFPHPDGL